jgi:hypothetical protein
MDAMIWNLAVIASLALALSSFLWATFSPFPRCEVAARDDPQRRRGGRE